MMQVQTYDAVVDAIEANGEPPVFVVGDRMIEIRGTDLLCYVKAPPARHGSGYNVGIRCEAQWVLGTPYRTEDARTAFFTALADVLQAAALVDSAIAPLRDAA